MTAATRLVLLLGLVLACFACGGSSEDDTSADEVVASSSDYLFVAPSLKSGAHYWTPVVMQDAGDFEGTLAFRSATPEGEPDQLVVIDKTTGAISFVAAGASDSVGDWESSRQELGGASQQLTVMAGDFDTGGTRFAALVNENNKCFIKAAAIALALVAAVVALPFIIEAAPVALAGAVANAQSAGAAIAANGLRAFAVQAGKAVLTNPAAQKYIAYKVTKTAVKGWLLFSDKGKEITHAVLDQAKEVWNAKCELSSPGALEGTMLGVP